MKSFYGDMTPSHWEPSAELHGTVQHKIDPGIVGTRLTKLVKGLDPGAAKIEPAQIGRKDRATKGIGPHGGEYPSIPITPAMREKILKEGLPLFLTPLGLGMAAEGMGEEEVDPVHQLLQDHYGDDS